MRKNITITPARKATPDLARLVHALLLLARARAEAERAKEVPRDEPQ